jgi:hypothetical protein
MPLSHIWVWGVLVISFLGGIWSLERLELAKPSIIKWPNLVLYIFFSRGHRIRGVFAVPLAGRGDRRGFRDGDTSYPNYGASCT